MYTFLSKNLIDENENILVYKNLHKIEEKQHQHDFFELVYVYEGSGTHFINGEEVFVKRGDLLIMGIKDIHSFVPNGQMGLLNCLISPEFISEELLNSYDADDILSLTMFKDFHVEKFVPIIKFPSEKFNYIEKLFNMMQTEFSKKETGYLSVIKSYLNIIFINIFRELEKDKKIVGGNHFRKISENVLKYIEENYNKKISLNDLAKYNFYNPSYFSKIFKECYGKTLTQYVNDLRINEAINLLENTQKTISEIALEVGFSDRKQFYKIFKEYRGVLPTAFRKEET